MNKKLYYLFLLCLSSCFILASCVDDDDFDIDEEWYSEQATIFSEVVAKSGIEGENKEYITLESQSKNGVVCWQKSTVITDSDNTDKTLRITMGGKPEFTDTVVVRYEGWYIDKEGKKYIFDSTENPSLNSGNTHPNKVQRKFTVNGVIEGWTIALQDMKVGEERLVVIPQILGYKGSPLTNSSSQVILPGYSTLWFRIKLFDIIPMKGIKN